MKLKLPEHDHKLTNFLKVLLFGLLMCLPFLDIGTRCGYVLLNKNAYKSYYGETINQSEVIDVDTRSNLEVGKNYYSQLNKNYFTDSGGTNYLYVTNFKVLETSINITNDLTNVTVVQYYYTTSNNDCAFYFKETKDGTSLFTWFATQTSTGYINFTFDYFDSTNDNVISIFRPFYYVYNSYSYLDNVFDYSINKMAESPLYNWTQSTGMYTGVNAMTTGLGITTPLFAILITYWLFLTIIYIILDIVLTLFTFMTHIFTSKKE